MDKRRNKYIWLIICSMASFFTFASSSEGMNYILIAVMGIVPILLVFQFRAIANRSTSLVYAVFGTMLLSSLLHSDAFRIDTILYSLMFIFTFVYYCYLVDRTPLTVDVYGKLIVFLLWAFFVTMVCQQICAFLNLPIVNYRVGDQSTFKVNSLASEPSYFGKIVTLLMISYITIREVVSGEKYKLSNGFKQDRTIWIIFLYQMLFCGSSFALILLAVVLFKYAKITLKSVMLLAPFVILATTVLGNLDLVVLERVLKIGEAILTLDENKIFEADQSGAFRIVPTIYYFKQVSFFSPDFWLGAGIDHTKNVMPTLMASLDEHDFAVGLFPAFIWDFGLIATIVLLIFVFRYGIAKDSKVDFLIWLLIVLDAPFNTQLFWITIMLMFSNKFFRENADVEEHQQKKENEVFITKSYSS
ncbi:hypothetical protein F1649_12870 [Arcticibacter tournemirensis]|uniref:O-antigen ligase domain-containing protein n=1 Tax=Arcticibacter tournemirensis TaxID=699437 RepID=A0A5M9H9Y0_9SPHI|nr:hypothetical protein [Arcticibacter tournemirensis]KAA8482028.1 hypothetical protein F1649_12870 [Arcticibacter tournemirensis]